MTKIGKTVAGTGNNIVSSLFSLDQQANIQYDLNLKKISFSNALRLVIKNGNNVMTEYH